MAYLVLRLRGPLLSLAGPRIDGHPASLPIPAASMVAGILGAALGYRREDPRLTELAVELRYGVIVHQPGVPGLDFQTADLKAIGDRTAAVDVQGSIHLIVREGSNKAKGSQIQKGPFLADADMTVLVELPAAWSANDVLEALWEPVFPMYLGRMGYLPSADIGERVIDRDTLTAAVAAIAGERPGTRYLPVSDLTDGLVVSIPSRGCGSQLFAVTS
jgi:CRISPR system Cascade subunit CasD